MLKVSVLDELLARFLSETSDLLAVLVVDFDGLIIAKQSIHDFDEETLGAIISILDETINKIKRFANTSFGSGTFDTNTFRLFYMELGTNSPTIFAMIADQYNEILKYIPYSYIVAEKITQILNYKDTSISLPSFKGNGQTLSRSTNPEGTIIKSLIHNIIIVGSEQAGKSSLVDMYVNENFKEEYSPTIGVSFVEKEFQITKEIKLIFHIYDMGGLKCFAKIRKTYYESAEAVIIMFDFSKFETANEIYDWIEEARKFTDMEEIPYILVGNKVDLIENRTEISTKVNQIVQQYNLPYFETSALTGEGLDELFMHLTLKLT